MAFNIGNIAKRDSNVVPLENGSVSMGTNEMLV